MKCGYQCGQLCLWDILKLIYSEHNDRVALFGGLTNSNDQIGKISIKITRISKARLWIEIDGNF
jgi:hypothetical protein